MRPASTWRCARLRAGPKRIGLCQSARDCCFLDPAGRTKGAPGGLHLGRPAIQVEGAAGHWPPRVSSATGELGAAGWPTGLRGTITIIIKTIITMSNNRGARVKLLRALQFNCRPPPAGPRPVFCPFISSRRLVFALRRGAPGGRGRREAAAALKWYRLLVRPASRSRRQLGRPRAS